MRTATIKVGPYEAVFDGEKFTSSDQGMANILNSALGVYRKVGCYGLGQDPGYWPDSLRGLAAAIAKYQGGELVRCDPMEEHELPEGAVY